MESSISKAGDITKAFGETFTTPEAIKTGESLTTQESSPQKNVKTPGDDTKRKVSVTPEYFTMKNPKTWGFK